MKKIILFSAVGIIAIIAFLSVISKDRNSENMQREDILLSYTKALEEGVPDGLSLTIYYMDPTILTRKPVSVGELLTFHDVKKIQISYDELVSHYELLTKLDTSKLEPAVVKTGINARLYYVLETKDAGPILEVVVTGLHDSVFVNGFEVKGNVVFFELIAPFVDEHFINMWGDIKNLTEDDCAY
ncbi:MAG: hypothetical protein ACI3W5_09160 [Faecousia sp.]